MEVKMIKKIIIIFILVISVSLIKDYYFSIAMSFHDEKPKIFETRDKLLFKSTNKVDSELK